MLLDYVEYTGFFTLRVDRAEADVSEIMREHGLDMSLQRSTEHTALLMTKEPYAAASFAQYATPQARAQLQGILNEVEKSWALSSDCKILVPYDQELAPFQKASVAYALGRKHTLVGDQPGLGKTPIAISFANEIKAKRVLVICPASIRIQWVNRIRAWTTMRYPYVIHPILQSRHGVHPDANWTIISYDLAWREALGRALSKQVWDLVIIDEAHYLKNVNTNRTRALFGGGKVRHFPPILDNAERILALSGTPLPNRPREAYTLARGLCFESIDWMSEDDFRERFNPSMRREVVGRDGTKKMFIDERSGRHGELQNRMRGNFMVRHMKREVLTQLKLPVYDLIQLEETGPIKQALAAENMLQIDPENLEGCDAEILGHISVVRKEMGIAMAPQIAEYCAMLMDGGEEKLVLFGWHIEVLNIWERMLQDYGVLRIDGNTSNSRREARKKAFVNDPTKHILIGNMQSMGVGTDGLQEVCNHALIGEPDWVPGNNEQAFDRLDRMGQKLTVQGDIFVAPNSIAEKVLASALRKNQTVHKSLDRRM